MSERFREFVGRESELDALRGAVADAMSRRLGSFWLLAGEAGIGKSRLAEELSRRAADEFAALVLWGRASESGEAPPYWPFIQVLRALDRHPDAALDAQRDAILPLLAPAPGPAGEALALPAAEARFRLHDAVATALLAASERVGLLVVLEDLHAADASTLSLLGFVADQVRSGRVCLVGTMRDTEKDREAVRASLERLERSARVLSLRRLGRAETAAYLAAALPEPPSDAVVTRLYETTEGHPLFLVETTRRLATEGRVSLVDAGGAPVVPRSVHAAIAARLDDLEPETRAVLDVASVLGRDLDPARVAVLLDPRLPAPVLERALVEATHAGILVEVEPGRRRFAHILVRDVVHRRLDPGRSALLHRSVAADLAGRADPPWAEVADHLQHAGPDAAAAALVAAEHAARQALDRLALDEHARWLGRAMALADTIPAEALGPCPDARRAELVLARGQAQIQAGQVAEGQASCRVAADYGRRLGDATLVARAALARGTAFVYGDVDADLVASLEEALDALGSGDSALHALVLARLAAAMQPAPDPREPIAMAERAIAMARRVGDERTLLETLRSAVSAMMDLGDPDARIVLNREHLALAQRLGAVAQVHRASMRLAFDAYELGEVDEASRAIDTASSAAEKLGHPAYGWQVAALRGARALCAGDFVEFDAEVARVRAATARLADPNAERTLLFQQVYRLRLEGRPEAVVGLLADLRDLFGATSYGQLICAATAAACLAETGRVDEARRQLGDVEAERALETGDSSLADLLIDFLAAAPDARLIARFRERFAPASGRFVSWGLLGMATGGPFDLLLARAAGLEGDEDAADALFERAARATERTGAAPHRAWVAFRHAEHLARLGESLRARDLFDFAEREARRLSMLGLAERAARARAHLEAVDAAVHPTSAATASPRGADADGPVALERDGEVWTLRASDGRSFRLEHSKGVAMLARLVAAPGRELHVLDLAGDGAAVWDRGDAGPLLDEASRETYRERVESLRDDLEEAERFGDPGRAERARLELEAIEEELARAVGLGGRGRRAASAAERARVNVQRRLKHAVRRIAEFDRELGRHLDRSLRTGTFCVYEPG